jgi:hypothetical protein
VDRLRKQKSNGCDEKAGTAECQETHGNIPLVSEGDTRKCSRSGAAGLVAGFVGCVAK